MLQSTFLVAPGATSAQNHQLPQPSSHEDGKLAHESLTKSQAEQAWVATNSKHIFL